MLNNIRLPGLVKGNVKSGHPSRGYADKDINISSSRHTEIDREIERKRER